MCHFSSSKLFSQLLAITGQSKDFFSLVQLQNITQTVHSEDTWCASLCCPSQFSLVILNILNPFTFLLPCTSVPPTRDARGCEMRMRSWGNTCLTMCFFRAIISKQRNLNRTVVSVFCYCCFISVRWTKQSHELFKDLLFFKISVAECNKHWEVGYLR